MTKPSKKYYRKLEMVKTQPNCCDCDCKLAVHKQTGNYVVYYNEATIIDDKLYCLQCNRKRSRENDIRKLSLLNRIKTCINDSTGLLTFLKRLKKRMHNYLYLNVWGNPKSKVTNKSRRQEQMCKFEKNVGQALYKNE